MRKCLHPALPKLREAIWSRPLPGASGGQRNDYEVHLGKPDPTLLVFGLCTALVWRREPIVDSYAHVGIPSRAFSGPCPLQWHTDIIR
jgi:hypothetical protein